MKLRHKIAWWVAGAGIITSLAFTFVVFLEMREQPYEILDSELGAAAKSLAWQLNKDLSTKEAAPSSSFSRFGDAYWVIIYDRDMHPIYSSDLAKRVSLPLRSTSDDGYTVTTPVPKRKGLNNSDRLEEVPFRVRVIDVGTIKLPYLVQIAKPMVKLHEEISDLWVALGIGLFVSTVLLVFVSYTFSGRIIRPIAKISRLAREINEKTLGERIPLGKSRDELYELSHSLNQMFDRLQYSFEQQKQFLANASHELKSPVAMLRLFFEEALRRPDLPESFQRQLTKQGDIVLRMERLVKALLQLSVLELQQSLDLKPFSLTDLTRSVLEDFSAVVAARRIRLEVFLSERLSLLGDKDMIRRALINIMDNAVNYNVEAGVIRLTIEEQVDHVHLTLFNTGPGIPRDELDKVFDQFYRVEKSRAQQYGGAGLGLAIVREIVRLHGGRIAMDSLPGQWAQVNITLPKPQRT